MKNSNLKLLALTLLTLLTACAHTPMASTKAEIYAQEQYNDSDWLKEKAKRENTSYKELIREQLPQACRKVELRGNACDSSIREGGLGFASKVLNAYCEVVEEKVEHCINEGNKILDNVENYGTCSPQQFSDWDFDELDVCVKSRSLYFAEMVAKMASNETQKCNVVELNELAEIVHPLRTYITNKEIGDIEHTGNGFYKTVADWKVCNE